MSGRGNSRWGRHDRHDHDDDRGHGHNHGHHGNHGHDSHNHDDDHGGHHGGHGHGGGHHGGHSGHHGHHGGHGHGGGHHGGHHGGHGGHHGHHGGHHGHHDGGHHGGHGGHHGHHGGHHGHHDGSHGHNYIPDGNGDGTITGTSGNDVLHGHGGDDRIIVHFNPENHVQHEHGHHGHGHHGGHHGHHGHGHHGHGHHGGHHGHHDHDHSQVDGGQGVDVLELRFNSADVTPALIVELELLYNFILENADPNVRTGHGEEISLDLLSLTAQNLEELEIFIDGVPQDLPDLFNPNPPVDDVIAGDAEAQTTFEAIASDATAIAGSENNSSILSGQILEVGSNVLEGNAGEDRLFGEAFSVDLIATAAAASASTIPNSGNNAIATASAEINGSTFIFAEDELFGGSGNDLLVGDTGDLNLIATAGTAQVIDGSDTGPLPFLEPFGIATADALITTNTFEMSVDTLFGGDGDDNLIGDVQKLTLTEVQGTTEYINEQEGGFNDGNNAVSAVATVEGNTFSFAGDLLDGENGSDRLVGDLAFGSVDEAKNTYIWGDDNLTGGADSDVFVFGLYENALGNWTAQGSDTVTDFSLQDGDELNFHSLLADASDTTVFSQMDFDTAIDTVTSDTDGLHIAFDGGGEVVLENYGSNSNYVYTDVATFINNFNVTFDTSDVMMMV